MNEKIRMKEWYEHFRRLLSGMGERVVRGRVREEGDEKSEIEREKMRKITRSLKWGKAAGSDGIPEEIWKYGGGYGVEK